MLEILEDRTNPTTFMLGNGDVTDLIADITTANTDHQADIIELATNGTYTLTAVNNTTNGANALPVILSSNLTIEGNGAAIERSQAQGTPAFRIFDVGAGGNLTLETMIVSGGLAKGSTGAAGGAGAAGAAATAAGGGGGAGHNGSAGGAGGAAQGGGIYVNGGTLVLDNDVTVQQNTVQGGAGGVGGNGGNGGKGGAAAAANSASGKGTNGGDGGKGGDGGDAGNGGSAEGGGIYVQNGSLTLIQSNITGNIVQAGVGGAGGQGAYGGTGGNGGPGAKGASSALENGRQGGKGGKGGNGGSNGSGGVGGAGGNALGGGVYINQGALTI